MNNGRLKLKDCKSTFGTLVLVHCKTANKFAIQLGNTMKNKI